MGTRHTDIQSPKMAATVRKRVVAFCGVLATFGAEIHGAGSEERGTRIPQPIEARIKPCGYPPGTRGDEVGTALVHVWIDETGLPTKTSLSSSSGSQLLDAAALECAKKSTWGPGQREGKPTASETDTKFEWTGTPLTETCDRPVRRNSVLTTTVRLIPEAVARVAFDHPKPQAALSAGVIGQSVICACIDQAGQIKDPVRLMQESGSSLLDTQALEIGKTMVYAAGHPGCMRNAINFTGPND
jgi:TonB family protein